MALHDTAYEKVITAFIDNPERTKAVCEEFGIWDALKEDLLAELVLARCREDVNFFIPYVFIDPETNEYCEQQQFHCDWQTMISENPRTLIAAPRGHGKTIQVAGRILWELGRNHELRVKIVGASDDKAKEILGLIRDMIANSDRLSKVFPDLKIDTVRGDTKTAFFINRKIYQRDPSVEATGVLSAGAGGRADLLVCDDVVDLKNAVINPALREQVIQAVKETWFSLVSANGKIVWICTPYHLLDASHNLKDTGEFAVWWKPAKILEIAYDDYGEPIRDENMELVTRTRVLWPDKWSEEKLQKRKELIGTQIFERQYMLNAISDEEKTFPTSSLEKSYDRGLAYIGEGIEPNWLTYGGIDLASALGKKNAYTVIWTLARSPYNNKLYFKDIIRKRMTFSDTITYIIDQYKKHNWVRVFVENNGYQQAVIDALNDKDATRNLYLPVQGFTTGAYNKANELIGLPALNVAFEHGKFAIPAARFPLDTDDTSPLGIFMRELEYHPGAEFSDTVMALWFAYRASIEDISHFEDVYLEVLEAV